VLEAYNEQINDPRAGRTPRVEGDGLTVADLCNRFLAAPDRKGDRGSYHFKRGRLLEYRHCARPVNDESMVLLVQKSAGKLHPALDDALRPHLDAFQAAKPVLVGKSVVWDDPDPDLPFVTTDAIEPTYAGEVDDAPEPATAEGCWPSWAGGWRSWSRNTSAGCRAPPVTAGRKSACPPPGRSR
jgi:hypothetical protein